MPQSPKTEILIRYDAQAMNEQPCIRHTVASDEPALIELYRSAFPHEDLVPLVRRLLVEVPDILSLVAIVDEECAGHVFFTPCDVAGSAARVALLGPLAVAPSRQRRGLAGMLISEGFSRLADKGLSHVLVLGDPAFYVRFGFQPENSIAPPYELPAAWSEAWQSVTIAQDASIPQGALRPPAVWLVPALWSP